MTDQTDTADVCAIMALLPPDAVFPCEVEVTARDDQGRITAIKTTPLGDDHADK